jgi:hypothetical protein
MANAVPFPFLNLCFILFCSASPAVCFLNAADPLALSVAMSSEPMTTAITLEAGLRLQHEAIQKQLPGAAEDEDDIRNRGTQLLTISVIVRSICSIK